MKAKLDENLGNRAIELFQTAGQDTATVPGQHLGGASDEDLISVCQAEGRVLATLNLGFSNVLRFPPRQHAGIAVLRVSHR